MNSLVEKSISLTKMRLPVKRTTKAHSKDNLIFSGVSAENYSVLSCHTNQFLHLALIRL